MKKIISKIESFFNSQTPLRYILAFIISYIVYTSTRSFYHFKFYTVYAIAECVAIEHQNTDTFAVYEFYVDKKKIDGDIQLGLDDDWEIVNKFFRVKYSSKDPEINELVLARPVYDTVLIKNAGFTIKKKKKKKRNQFQEF
ncbi:hypothetical protein [uncultured Maribacter sp.]|uniref:hypothetical protein n=1 Tax=uncultured Maribacter sp. TaxID=431308 RepID=UPI002633F4FC|nr:hypothetical protein [uncultured Maribacter sp.]